VDILIQKTALKLLHECIESNTLEVIMMNKQKMQFQMKVSIENEIYLVYTRILEIQMFTFFINQEAGQKATLKYGVRFTRILIRKIKIISTDNFGTKLLFLNSYIVLYCFEFNIYFDP